MFFILFFLLFSFTSEATQADLCEDVFSEKNQGDMISLMPYEEAKAFVQELGFNNRAEFFKFVQSTELPDGFPKNPHIAYKEEWEDWDEFLGFNKRKGEFINKVFEIADEAKKRPAKKPKDKPITNQTKTRRGQQGIIISQTPRPNPRRKWMPYEEAKALIQAEGVQDHKQFLEWSRRARPFNFPSTPAIVYAEEWEGWAVFFGVENKPRGRKWMPYEEAKALMRAEGIQNYKQFEQWKKNRRKYFNFPSTPAIVYAEEWEGWAVFFGVEN